jgi:tricarballylate dehydrogenase
VISAFAREVPPTIAWLQGFGVRFEALPTPFLTRSAPKLMPIGGGLAMIEALTTQAEGHGVEFRFETTGIALLQDQVGAVCGLQVLGKGHKREDIAARHVVLASGGFEGNLEMLTQYLGPHALHLRPVARGGYFNKGEGIRMALAIGAAPCGDYGNYHAEPIDPRSGIAEPAIFAFPYGVLVNKAGRRFVDEAPGPVDSTYEEITRLTARQPGGIAYAIFDAKIADIPNFRVTVRSDQPAIVADSLEALAAKLDVPAHALADTIAQFNSACRTGRFAPLELDGLATAGIEPVKSNFARPIDWPPFSAWPMISANVFTFGGLKVNGAAQVLDVAGDPIPGLYAAGEVVGIYYKAYTGATSVLKGATFGRLAGRHTAGVPAASAD